MTAKSERRRMQRMVQRPSHERWLVSYADFITLMFALFTTMYAVSAVDAGRLDTMAESVSMAFDRDVGAEASVEVLDPTVLSAAARIRELEGLRNQLTTRFQDDPASDLIDLRLDGRGLVISLREAGAFPTGSADLALSARRLVETVGDSIHDLENIVRVEGHTDDVPIFTSEHRSNWELSTARATSVVRHVVEVVGIPADRLAVAGYGEHRPLAPNDSDVNRAKNRRVDIVVLSTRTADTEEPPALPVEEDDA